MVLMMPCKRQVPRGTVAVKESKTHILIEFWKCLKKHTVPVFFDRNDTKCCLKNQNYVIRKNWKFLPENKPVSEK
jgi:hypothetical protein